MAGELFNPRKARKSKRGCQTCKIRHVKCDETKPACLKCESTGRKCDYLEASVSPVPSASDKHSAHPPVVRKVRSASVSPDLEIQGLAIWFQNDPHASTFFNYFRTVCSKEFQGYCSTRLWESFFLQVAHAESPIRHALLALSAMHYSVFACQNASTRSSFRLYAKSQFIDAARELNKKLDHSLYSHKLALVASLAFILYELLSGDEIVSLLHLRGGANILASLHAKAAGLSGFSEPDLPPDKVGHSLIPLQVPITVIDTDLAEMTDAFARAVTEVSTYGTRYMFTPLVEPALPKEFFSLCGPDGARYYLDLVIAYMFTTIDFRLEAIRTLPSKQLASSLMSQILVVKDLLSRWISIFAGFQSSVPPVAEKEQTISDILEIQHRLASLKLATHFYKDESIYDSYQSEFQEIVSRCERVLFSSSNPGKGRFSADSAVVHPLYYVALKSRSGTLRRRALSLLRHAGREAAHDGEKQAAAAHWVIEREEADAKEIGSGKLVSPNLNARMRVVALRFDQSEDYVLVMCARKNGIGEWTYFGGLSWYDGVERVLNSEQANMLARELMRYREWHATTL